jgi:leucyl aminopeptidase (aminopeptidase T)
VRWRPTWEWVGEGQHPAQGALLDEACNAQVHMGIGQCPAIVEGQTACELEGGQGGGS